MVEGEHGTLAHGSESVLRHPADCKPWEDASCTPAERLAAYKMFVAGKIESILAAWDNVRGDLAKQQEIQHAPETQRWYREALKLRHASPEDFCYGVDFYPDFQQLLGKNFLGAEAWRSQGIDVGDVPAVPASITRGLLESDCPLHPGEKIKDTHLLVLMPKMVNGEPYSALKLDELCAVRKGSGDKLIFANWRDWKDRPWAAMPQIESGWILIPKYDPNPRFVLDDKHFRYKSIAEQQKVHEDHYPDYREGRVLEVMTSVLLYDLVNKQRYLGGYLRCAELNQFRTCRVAVGFFYSEGLRIESTHEVGIRESVGRALARKL
jgi:hypothetical protein